MFTSRGIGFRRLAESHAGSVGGDTLVTIALAGTLFFDVPSTEARDNVALYLLITLAPFAVIGPIIGALFERFPAAYRSGLAVSAALRVVVAIIMAFGLDTFWLFPLAFLAMVLSRFHGISKSSVLPIVLDSPTELVTGNAQFAKIGFITTVLVGPIGALAQWQVGPWLSLVLAAILFAGSAWSGMLLPALTMEPIPPARRSSGRQRKRHAPRPVRLAQFATAGVRFLNGFLLLLVAFAFRSEEAGVLDFTTLLGAAGVGYFLAAVVTPTLERYLSEEPMVVAALALEAGAAFIAAQIFGLAAAAVLAGAAGFAWGTAKFGFDGLLQATLPSDARGRAFTNSETLFQIAWVVGALIPVIISLNVEFGLAMAGVVALFVQVVYVSAVLVPVVMERRGNTEQQTRTSPPDRDVMDLL